MGCAGIVTPDIVSMNPSWNHNYASLGWWGGPPAPAALHYPSIKPELVGLIEALHGLAHDADRRASYLADRVAYAERFGLTAEQRSSRSTTTRSLRWARTRSCRSSPACKSTEPVQARFSRNACAAMLRPRRADPGQQFQGARPMMDKGQ